ncbi:MAG: ParB/RepB/Spo0J family partition protein [Planctomycetia bacterium]|nr:ParB/RepB/Spo0J family partition protein [Planctomycetia bacterium]
MFEQKRLGRGLEALLGRPLDQGPASSLSEPLLQVEDEQGFTSVPVRDIDPNPFQPRNDYDDAEIQALADSIVEHGLLQPPVVRRVGNRYQLIAGERRLKAVIRAGFENVTVQVREADDRQLAEMAVVENLQRKDLNAIEKARSFQQYLQRFGCTQEELAQRLQLDRSTVANLVRLLELPAAVQQLVREGKISQGHARALLPLGVEEEQLGFAQRIVREGLSVRATESLVQETVKAADVEPLAVFSPDATDPAAGPARTRQDNLADLEQELRRVLGTKVELKQTKAGSGRIVIHFASPQEFERLQGQLYQTAGQPRVAQAA